MQIGRSVSSWTMRDRLGEQLGLVGERDAHVDVEHVGAALDLGLHVALDRGQVAGAQLLLEDPAAGRVDPLADQAEAGGRGRSRPPWWPSGSWSRARAAGHGVASCRDLRALARASRSLARLTVGRGVGGVAVGTDRVGVLLGDGGAADHDDRPSSRRPAFSSAFMLALNIGIVVVRNAEKPTMSGWCSSIADDELLRRHLDAEVDHLEAGALEHDVDEVLADVVDVALDRAHQELADGLRRRSRRAAGAAAPSRRPSRGPRSASRARRSRRARSARRPPRATG